jgi:hypothetical protein|tara:strand:+ start:193 stop:933 length:741 start_codon:yes stop_codon:yes gene_type:complete
MGNDQAKQEAPSQPRQTREQRAAKQAQSAIGTQKSQMKLIEKRIAHKEKQMVNMRNEAKAIIAKAKTPSQKKAAKRQAGLKLKRIKIMQKQVTNDHNQLTRLMQQELALEQAVANTQSIAATKAANSAFRNINMDIDQVEDVIEENQEMMDMQSEITDVLGQQIGDDIDEDEMEAEWEALVNENAMEEMDQLPNVPNTTPSLSDSGRRLAQQGLEAVLPVAPTGAISTPNADEDDEELMALEAMMA